MREKTLGPCAVLWVHGRRTEAVGAAGMRSVLPVSSRPSLPLSWAPLHAPAPCGGGVGSLPSERGPRGADGRARGCFQATPAASCCYLDSEVEPGPLGPAPRAWGGQSQAAEGWGSRPESSSAARFGGLGSRAPCLLAGTERRFSSRPSVLRAALRLEACVPASAALPRGLWFHAPSLELLSCGKTATDAASILS